MFITFEGGEGTGKSTQVQKLSHHFRSLGRDVVVSREPGGTPQAERVRNLLVNGEPGDWSAEAEALLNYAARDSHLRTVIRPALAQGKTVISDRFMDSTRAYQGFAGGCPADLLDRLEADIVGKTRPALTFLLDLDPAAGLARAQARGAGNEDRYERKGLKFHQLLRQGFLSIAAHEPQRVAVVDAGGTVEQVWHLVCAELKARGHG
jgi:dTMP kinase